MDDIVEYDAAIVRLSSLMDENPAPGSNEEAELKQLADAIESYERLRLNVRRELIAELSGDGVLIRLERPEGYEDTNPQIVAEDALRDSNWPYEVLTDDFGGIKKQ